jgi:hypothetical protein
MKWAMGLVAALMCSGIAAPADAALVYSLTGTVGDSNWFATGSPDEYAFSRGIVLPASPPPPGFTGSFGTFSTNPVQYYFEFTTSANLKYSSASDVFLNDIGEIIDGHEFSLFGGGGINAEGNLNTTNTSHSSSFQVTAVATSTYIDEGYVTDYLPIEEIGITTYTGELVHYDTSTALVSADWEIRVIGRGGEPFSVLVYSVPEPEAWSLMILGFAGIGAAMRMSRRRAAGLLA